MKMRIDFSIDSNTAGNVVRGNRKVMQSESSRELPNMIDEIRQNVNSQVSFHEFYFFSFILYKKGNTILFSISCLYPKRMNRAHKRQ